MPLSSLDLLQDPQSPLVLKEPALGPSREPEPIENHRKGREGRRGGDRQRMSTAFSLSIVMSWKSKPHRVSKQTGNSNSFELEATTTGFLL